MRNFDGITLILVLGVILALVPLAVAVLVTR